MSFLFIAASIVLAFIVTLLMFLPTIRRVKVKKISIVSEDSMLRPVKMTPFGCVALLSGITATLVLNFVKNSSTELIYIFISILLLFIYGLFNETKQTSKWKLVIVATVVSILIVGLGDIRITQFHNVFGLKSIPYIISFLCSILFVFLTILAYSVVPKMDKLITGLTIIAGLSFGIWFFASRQIQFSSVAFALSGCVLAFYAFNIFNVKRKMILGETGMLIVGFLIAVLAIKTNEFDTSHTFQPVWVSNPVFVFAIVGLPMIELSRIFILRILQNKPVLASDTNHIYYELYRITNDHTETTSVLILFSVLMIITSVVLNSLEMHVYLQLCVLFIELLFLYSVTFSYFRKKIRKLRNRLLFK